MYFLQQDDFDMAIRGDQLDKILGANTAILNQAVNTAITEVDSYIKGRYDAAAAFAASGTSRDYLVVSTLVDMALYHLYSRINARNIPDLRRQRYEEALDLYKGVSKGTRYLNLPLLVVAGQTTYYLHTGNTKPNLNGHIW